MTGESPHDAQVVPVIRVFILDDHEVVREGLRLALSRVPHVRVLGEHGIPTRVELASATPNRPWVMQYRESPLAFVERLLAEAGMAYFLRPTDEGDDELVVIDSPRRYEDVRGLGTLHARAADDGAAALVLMERAEAERRGIRALAKLVAYAHSGVDPKLMGIGPVPASRSVLERAGLKLQDFDYPADAVAASMKNLPTIDS